MRVCNTLYLGQFLTLLLLCSCQSPFIPIASGELRGELSTATSFSFAQAYRLMQLETLPKTPYSVYLRVNVFADHLYIDAAPNRRWHRNLQIEPEIRIKLGDYVYQAIAVKITDPTIATHFFQGRTIYRIDPRP